HSPGAHGRMTAPTGPFVPSVSIQPCSPFPSAWPFASGKSELWMHALQGKSLHEHVSPWSGVHERSDARNPPGHDAPPLLLPPLLPPPLDPPLLLEPAGGGLVISISVGGLQTLLST